MPQDKVDPRKQVHSRIIRTVDDLENWIEEFGPAGRGMLTSKTKLRSYEKGGKGFEIVWSPSSKRWFVAEMTEEEVAGLE